MRESISTDTARQIEAHILAGRKIDAIKLYRENSGQGLKEAKEFVESFEAELRAESPEKFTSQPGGKGCLGAAAVLGIGFLTTAIFLWTSAQRWLSS